MIYNIVNNIYNYTNSKFINTSLNFSIVSAYYRINKV